MIGWPPANLSARRSSAKSGWINAQRKTLMRMFVELYWRERRIHHREKDAKSGTPARFTVQMADILRFSFSSFLLMMTFFAPCVNLLHIRRGNVQESNVSDFGARRDLIPIPAFISFCRQVSGRTNGVGRRKQSRVGVE
jgi:hypothetical protein